jgi:hypothetical protein
MAEKDLLFNFLDHEPTRKELAGHFADRLAALEQLYRAQLFCGGEECADIRSKISSLQEEARACGFNREDYPGFFLGLPGKRENNGE